MASSSTLNNLQVNKLQANELIVTGEKQKFTMEHFDTLKKILKEGIRQEKVVEDTTGTTIQSSGIQFISHVGLYKIRGVRISKLHKKDQDPLDVYSYRTYKFDSQNGEIYYDKYTVDTKGNRLGGTRGRITELTENSFTVEWSGHRYSLNKTISYGTTTLETDGEKWAVFKRDPEGALLQYIEFMPFNLFSLL